MNDDDHDGAGYGAGTDCLGFVTRAASYSQNPYSWAWNNLPISLWGGVRAGINFPRPEQDGFVIADYTNFVVIQNPETGLNENIPINLERIVPGDIFYILMVVEVDYGDSNERTMTPEGVRFIESTQFNENIDGDWIKKGCVKNYRTLSGVANNIGIADREWYALRLGEE
jgi:hypothetical protein